MLRALKLWNVILMLSKEFCSFISTPFANKLSLLQTSLDISALCSILYELGESSFLCVAKDITKFRTHL
jgi:hypothetical protein